ncbi:LysM peptidoglycan-binding domain-containing protein [Patescibacteria group bacterium]|nr:LysM peptidoglycan-binding domain-containing protein [Patescibacteria group bacterium]
MGVISVILLSILSFAPHHFWLEVNSIVIAKNLNASLVNPSNQPENGGEPFLGPIKNSLEESPDFLLIQKSSLVAFSPPILVTPQVLGSLFGDSESELGATTREEIIEYTVQPGDTLTSIAAHFGISLNTLLWANDLSQKSTIKPGKILIILPVSGVIHHVKDGDTTAEIAKRYKGDVDKIIAFNNLSEEGDVFIGDILIIPDGVMPQLSIKQATTEKSSSEIPPTSSYFFYPVPSSYKITQGLHWYNALDIGNGTCGGPVYAAASGTVQKTGYDGTAGKFIRILHPNNVVIFYGHLSGILAIPGEQVSQGQIIGYIGNTGYTVGRTGYHLHFGVHGARNPFAR